MKWPAEEQKTNHRRVAISFIRTSISNLGCIGLEPPTIVTTANAHCALNAAINEGLHNHDVTAYTSRERRRQLVLILELS